MKDSLILAVRADRPVCLTKYITKGNDEGSEMKLREILQTLLLKYNAFSSGRKNEMQSLSSVG